MITTVEGIHDALHLSRNSTALGAYNSKAIINRTHQHTHADTPVHRHTDTHTHTYLHTHTHTHTHTH